MKKYICIVTLILVHAAWSMDHKKHSFKAVNPNDLKTTLHSFSTHADRKAGEKALESFLDTHTPHSTANSNATTFTDLFVVHSEFWDNEQLKKTSPFTKNSNERSSKL
jgi:hypothetical protein